MGAARFVLAFLDDAFDIGRLGVPSRRAKSNPALTLCQTVSDI